MQKLVPIAVATALAIPIAAVSASGGGTAEKLNLVTMDEVRVPIIDGARADGTLRFKLVLEAKDEEAAHELTATMPMLRSTSLGAGVEFGRLYASPMMPVDAGELAKQLTAALKAQDPSVERVLLVKVMATRD